MTTEDTPQMPLFSPEDEKEAQRELKRLRKSENGVFKVNHKRTGFEGKTLWDWLQLLGILAIPLVVAGATILFGIQQAQNSLDQQQAAILQTYIDNMQDLLLNHNLLKSNSNDPSNPYHDIATLAQARTLTALQGLNPERKGRLLQFIYSAKLIGFTNPTKGIREPPIISLSTADLTGAILNTEFSTAFSDADFSGANLSRVDLVGAIFSDADLVGANLNGADLRGAYLNGADLSNANNLTQAQLDQVFRCKGAILPTGLTCHHNQ